MIVYKATNIENNMVYIGQTTRTLEKRKQSHLNESRIDNYYFHNALKKYGVDGFEWKIIYHCKDIDELYCMERYFIQLYNTIRPYGYNLTLGGEGNFGWVPKEQTKRNISKALEGRKRGPFTDEHKKNIGESQRGRKRPYHVGKNNPSCQPEVREKIRTIMTGKTLEDRVGVERATEIKNKMSKKQLGVSFETRFGVDRAREIRAKQSQSHIGKNTYPKTDEHKQKLRESRSLNEYLITSPDGIMYTTKSLKQFCKDMAHMGVDKNLMYMARHNKSGHSKGWKCKIIGENHYKDWCK